MSTNNPHQCIESFRDALKRAGLEERRADISPGLMAPIACALVYKQDQRQPQGTQGAGWRNFSIGFWILILAFVLGLAPAVAIGAFALAAKSRGMYEGIRVRAGWLRSLLQSFYLGRGARSQMDRRIGNQNLSNR